MAQTNINEWLVIAEKIEKNRILRFPYKRYTGFSLTRLILNENMKGYNSYETYSNIIKSEGIQILLFEFPDYQEKILENIWVSVCARYSETATQDKVRGV